MTNKLKEEFFDKFTTTYDDDYGNSPDDLSLGFSEDITPENILTFIESKLASQREEIKGKLIEELNRPSGEDKNLDYDLGQVDAFKKSLSILQEMEN